MPDRLIVGNNIPVTAHGPIIFLDVVDDLDDDVLLKNAIAGLEREGGR
jgi:hypothetical protein